MLSRVHVGQSFKELSWLGYSIDGNIERTNYNQGIVILRILNREIWSMEAMNYMIIGNLTNKWTLTDWNIDQHEYEGTITKKFV